MKWLMTLSFHQKRPFFGLIFLLKTLLFGTHFWINNKIKKRRKLSKYGELYVFSHIPKTAGNYVNAVTNNIPLINISHCVPRKTIWTNTIPIGLSYINEKKLANIDKSVFITVVREPESFFASYWNHASGSNSLDYALKYQNNSHYDFVLSGMGVRAFLEEIINRQGYFPSKNFLFPQLFNSRGECIIDLVFFQSNLEDQLKNYFNNKGYTLSNSSKKRRSPNNDTLKFEITSFREKLKEIYSREYFMFKFDKNSSINVPMSIEKADWNYDYSSDTLYYKNKIVER